MNPFWKKQWFWGITVPLFISLLSLILTYLTYRANQRLNLAQAELVAGTSVDDYFYVDVQSQGSVAVICRTKLYINNFGTTDTLIDTISSSMEVNKLPNVRSVSINYEADLSKRSDYWSFSDKGVSVLTAFHNWGESAPSIDQVFDFYNRFGVKYIKDYIEDTDELTGLIGIVEPYPNGMFKLQSPSGDIRTSSNRAVPKLLKRQTVPIVVRGKKLTTITVDNVAFYVADDTPQRYLLRGRRFGGDIKFTIRFIDGTSSSKTIRCRSLLPGI